MPEKKDSLKFKGIMKPKDLVPLKRSVGFFVNDYPPSLSSTWHNIITWEFWEA